MWLLHYGGQNDLDKRSQDWALCLWNAHAQLSNIYRHIFTYHSEEMTQALGNMNRNELLTHVEPNAWKGSVFAFLSIRDSNVQWISPKGVPAYYVKILGVICLMILPM